MYIGIAPMGALERRRDVDIGIAHAARRHRVFPKKILKIRGIFSTLNWQITLI